jgi:Fe-S oxidoreductase
MEHAEILHRCFRCGYCKLPGSYQDLNCPSYLKSRFETYAPGGRMWLLRAWLDGEIETSQRLADILFSCAACGNCVEHCVFPEFKADLLNAFTAGKEELVDQGTVPETVAEYLKRIQLYGNAYGLPEADRGRWADGLDIQPYSGQEYLFYVGCPGSFDERGQAMARAVARLLKKWGVDFGILGERERCDGNEVRALGESGLFEQLAKENVEQWRAAGVTKILTLSPHAFHAIKNEYPKFDGAFEVYHYSQVLAGLLPGREFRQVSAEPLRVTFHDPCYLGRHNKDYMTPRAILGAVPGLELAEMDRAMGDALCCGGGGGNFFTDVLGGGADSSCRARVREAAETGAQVLAVACPKCAKMLEDAVKVENLDDGLRVMDIAEIVEERAA